MSNYPFSDDLKFCSKHNPQSDIIEVDKCQECTKPGYKLGHPLAAPEPNVYPSRPEKAKFPGMCYLCGLSIYVKDEIQRWTVADTPVAAHKTCVADNIAGGHTRFAISITDSYS